MEKIKSQALKIDVTWRYVIFFSIFYLIHIFFIPEEYAEITELFIWPAALFLIALSSMGNGLSKEFFGRNDLLNIKYRKANELLLQNNQKLYEMANKDALTGIYNRRWLIEELKNLTENIKHHRGFAMLFVDLDRFKNINDTYGHDIGDLLLKESVKRFQEIVEEGDFVARQGGDEFVIILKGAKNKEYVSGKCSQILNNMGKEFFLSGKKIKTSVSIGVALYPEHAQNHMELMKYGDRALYKSKVGGKNCFYIYGEDLQKIQDRRFLIENKLQNARIRKELYLLYQPQIDLKTGKMTGIEALLRWKNNELGEVSPNEFIPIAEEIGVIHSLGEFAIAEASRDIKYLNEKYDKNLKVGINVSPKQFFTDGFFLTLRKNMAENRVSPKWLDIEITENMAISNEAEVIRRLEALNRLGVSISIDDFGTGYSSLAYLKKYPVTTLKIAMELIRDLDKGKQDYNIVKAVIAMCREMGIETIAEGVENSHHFQILKDFGCDRIQGYYISEPGTIRDIEGKFLN
ncbi:MAG: putative bifunctional diguanylate cyclase/phosphodiesterase [Fusobacteriaceae bacterium]